MKSFYLFAAWGVLSLPLLADSVLVPDRATGVVKKVRSSGLVSEWLSGLSDPQQVALASNGDALVADSGLGQVLRFPVAGGPPVQVGPALPGANALGFDGAGVLFVLSGAPDTGSNTLFRLNDAGDAYVAVVPPLGVNGEFTSMAVSARGGLFIVDRAGNRILEVRRNGPNFNVTNFATGLSAPYGVALDATGKVFATDTGAGGRVVTFKQNGNIDPPLATGLGAGIRGLCFDSVGALHYVVDEAGVGALRKLVGAESMLIASGLGDVNVPTARTAQAVVLAFKGEVLTEPEAARFSVLNSPAIGGGVVAFKARLLTGVAGVSLANHFGIWKTGLGKDLTLVARRGSAIPGPSGSHYLLPSDPIVNGEGKLAFLSTLKGGDVTAATNWAVFTNAHVSGDLTPVLQKGGLAPGSVLDPLDPAVKFTAVRQLVLPDDSGPAVLATISGPGVTLANNLGLWSLALDGSVSLLVRKGSLMDCPDGKTRKLSVLRLFTAPILAQGQGRHHASGQAFTFVGGFTDGYSALIKAVPGMAPEVLEGVKGAVGEVVPTGLFGSFGSPAVSDDAGDFAFRTKMIPMPGTTDVKLSNAFAVFTQDSLGANTLAARINFPSPGVEDSLFGSLSDPVVSGGGSYAFWGKMKPGFGGVTIGTSAGLWADTGAGLGLIARQGQASVPGVPGAVKFTKFTRFVLPDEGGAIFQASLAGQGISLANNYGVWADDGAGGTEVMLRKGDSIMIQGVQRKISGITVFRTIAKLNGQSRHFDGDGTLVCQIACTDGMRALVLVEQP
jgi:hypothetical protein